MLPEGEDALAWVRTGLPKLRRDRANALVRSMLETFLKGGFEEETTCEMEGIWDALFEDGYAPHNIDQNFRAIADAQWLIWAWSPRWNLCDQDEDIVFLFDAPQRLLALAALGCPKRDYILGCVMHGVRDRAHAFVVHGTGPSPFEEAQSLIAPARSARAPELVDYFERLAGYATRGKVDRDGAIQRAHDLHRCAPPRTQDVEISLKGDLWAIHYVTPGAPLGAHLHIHRKTGVMHGAT